MVNNAVVDLFGCAVLHVACDDFCCGAVFYAEEQVVADYV